MAAGEIAVTCPNCQKRAIIPIAAVRRDNFYCSGCFERIPMAGIRTNSAENPAGANNRPKKSSRVYRR